MSLFLCLDRERCSRLDTCKASTGSKGMSLNILIDTQSPPSFQPCVRQLFLCNNLEISAARNNKHLFSGLLVCSATGVWGWHGWVELQAVSPILLGPAAPRGM